MHNAIAPDAPFMHAPEDIRTIHRAMLRPIVLLAIGSLLLFGFRSGVLMLVCVASYLALRRVVKQMTPAMQFKSRTYGVLSALLLSFTIPPSAPWYAAVIAAAFAVFVGEAALRCKLKNFFAPILIGRLAIAILLPATIVAPQYWPVLTEGNPLLGDLKNHTVAESWKASTLDPHSGFDAVAAPHPRAILRELNQDSTPRFGGLLDASPHGSAALLQLPKPGAMLAGRRGGELGATCSILLLFALAYLAYRHYLPLKATFTLLLAAFAVCAIAPIHLVDAANSSRTIWFPIVSEGVHVGILYCTYQLLAGGVLLGALILGVFPDARCVSPRGMVLLSLLCGAAMMLVQLYTPMRFPAYLALMLVTPLSPVLDRIGMIRLRR